MSLERVNPPVLGAPRGFSHAVVGDGRVVVLAGQTALNAEGVIVGEGVVKQFDKALDNLLVSLEAAGGTPADLAGLTIYCVDLGDYRARSKEIGAVWKRRMGTDYPATAGIGISRLWDDAALVEVQGIAIL